MKLLRAGLATALVGLGCSCVGPFPAGVRTGSSTGELETLAIRPTRDAQPVERLLRQETRKKALLLLTPEGPRSDYPIDASHRYFLQIGDGELQELDFLRVRTERNQPGNLSDVYALGDRALWVGIYPPSTIYPGEPPAVVPGRPHHFRSEPHTVIVFSRQGILRRFQVEAVTAAPEFTVQPDGNSLRYWRNDGWWLLEVDSGQQRPEPDQVCESVPDNRSVCIPQTGWKISFELPPFVKSEEAISHQAYEFRAQTHDDHRIPGGGGLSLFVLTGNHWGVKTKTRDDLFRYSYNGPPSDLHRTAQYDRVESLLKEDAQFGWPARKQIRYLTDLGDQPMEITLIVAAPFDRWKEVIARFESSLRIEAP
ncbi:MAG TPA: hypothetical protein VIM71_14490 [Lacunisphaera sp.]